MTPSKDFILLLHFTGRNWNVAILPENYGQLDPKVWLTAGSVFTDIDAFPKRDKSWLTRRAKRGKRKSKNIELPLEDMEAVLGCPPELFGKHYGFDVTEDVEVWVIEYVDDNA